MALKQKHKIAFKLPASIVLTSAVLAAIILVVSVLGIQSVVTRSVEAHFRMLVAERKATLENWLASIDSDIAIMAADDSTVSALDGFSAVWGTIEGNPREVLRDAYVTNNPHPGGQRHLLGRAEDTLSFNTPHVTFHPAFARLIETKGYLDVYLIDAEGDVIYSAQKNDDFATSLMSGAYSESGLAEVFRDAISSDVGTVHFSDLAPYAATGVEAVGFVAISVQNALNKTIGVLAFQIDTQMLNEVVNNASGLGATGQITLLAKDFSARSDSRFNTGSRVLDHLDVSEHVAEVFKQGSAFFADTVGRNGQSVVAFVDTVSFHDQTWAILVEQDAVEANSPVRKLRNNLVLVSFGCAAVLSLLGWFFAKTITQPLGGLSVAMRDVSQGNYQVEVYGADRRDEIGEIARNLVQIRSDFQSAEVAEAEKQKLQSEQDSVVNSLRQGLVRLAKGDFSETIPDPFPAPHDQLRNDFNASIENLNGALAQVVETAESIRRGASEISQASDDLSGRTENQAATLEETAAALQQLTDSVSGAAESAKSVEAIVTEARDASVESGTVVNDAVSAMTEIEASSHQISQIIGVIDDIAFQTNLLALNAGVEAARAGEAGKGFAVVASEVRALAQRSSDAAKEIKTLIGDSSQQVERGVHLVGKAGEALASISERVTHISELISGIASGAVTQSTGLGEINIGVTQLDEVTQQNAAMVEESTAASHMLNQDAERLSGLVAGFSLTQSAATPRPPVLNVQVPSAHGATWEEEEKFEATPVAVNSPSNSSDLWQEF